MRTVTIDESRIAARMRLIDEHLQAEMDLDLDRTMATLNDAPDYRINNDAFSGRESVRAFYAELFTGFPDIHFEVTRRYVSDEAIILEETVSGTHMNKWNGIPAPGRRAQFPICVICPFDKNDRMCGERVYFDNAFLMQQLGASPL
jgi:steroid delta-isomerase-like uncharacterized protein